MKKIFTIQKIALALSIVIVLNLFYNYGVFTFYKAPVFDTFCAEETRRHYGDEETCQKAGFTWRLYSEPYYERAYRGPVPPIARPIPLLKEAEDGPTGYCDTTLECRETYNQARDFYQRNVFVALVIAGALSMMLGFMITSAEAVSSGLLFGGIISILVGTMRYWSAMNDYLRFVILGIILAVLIWTGYKKLRDR